MTRVHFIYKDETHVMDACKVEAFRKELQKAMYLYIEATGRKPTHLVLGKEELLEWAGLIAWYSAEGLVKRTATLQPASYHSCIILNSSATSLLVAVELLEYAWKSPLS